MDHKWGHSSCFQGVPPPMAVVGGHDSDGSTIYVGRAMYQGDNLPAKVVPSRNEAYVSWGGNEVVIRNYEVLCGQNYKWIPCAHGQVPYNAVRSGYTASGEPLYIGRGHWQGSLTVGKIHQTHHCLYIPYGGKEHRLDTYEVLILERGDNWASVCAGHIPPGAVVGGHDSDGGTSHHIWVKSCINIPLPESAIVGGYDGDGTKLFIGRAYHNGELLPVKINSKNRTAYTCFEGYEFVKEDYEVLCGTRYSWIHCENGNIPWNAVSCGRAFRGEVYIGRGFFDKSLTVGKVCHGDDCLHIPYNGFEKKVYRYEILIKENCHVIPAQTYEAAETGHYELSEVAGGCQFSDHGQASIFYKPPLPRGKYESSLPSAPSLTFIKTEASSLPYPQEVGYNNYERNQFINGKRNDATNCYTYPSITNQIVKASVNNMPLPPPPYEIKEEVAIVHKKPPAFGFQVLPPLPPPPYEDRNDDTIWITWKSDTVPENSICGGIDTDLSPLYVGRCFHKGHLLPAKVNISKACAYVSFNGHEVLKEDYELLTGTGFEWIPSHDGYVLQDAVIGGRTADGETLYIGRGHHMNSITPGKVQPSENCLYISFGGGEVKLQNYEILVKRDDKKWNM